MILIFEDNDAKVMNIGNLKLQLINKFEDRIIENTNVGVYINKSSPFSGLTSNCLLIDTVGEFGMGNNLSLITQDYKSKLMTTIIFNGISIFYICLTVVNLVDVAGAIKLFSANKDTLSLVIVNLVDVIDSDDNMRKILDIIIKELENIKVVVNLSSSNAAHIKLMLDHEEIASEIKPVSEFKLKKMQDVALLPTISLVY